MTILIFLLLFYFSGVMIAYAFIDFWNISNPLSEKYSFVNAWKSWWTIYYLFSKSIEK